MPEPSSNPWDKGPLNSSESLGWTQASPCRLGLLCTDLPQLRGPQTRHFGVLYPETCASPLASETPGDAHRSALSPHPGPRIPLAVCAAWVCLPPSYLFSVHLQSPAAALPADLQGPELTIHGAGLAVSAPARAGTESKSRRLCPWCSKARLMQGRC